MPHPAQTPLRSSKKDAPPGFVLVLLLVALLVLALMSIAYLGVVRYRTQEIGIGQGGNIQQVVTSVENDIQGALMADYPVKGAINKPEPYDYPWTDASQTLMPYSTVRPAPGVGRQGFTLGNPKGDDAWLASSAVESGAWPHLSNLRGTFLDLHVSQTSDLSRINQDATRQYVPVEVPSNNLETAISANDPRLVDTDGDGIGDALWFYPAVSTLGDRRYAAAVYIEDLSAKINVNTALRLRAGGAYAAADKGPLGLTSSDVDLSALSALWPAITDASLASLADYRWGDPTLLAAPLNAAPYNSAKPAYGAGAPMDYLGRMRYWAQRACRAQPDGQPVSGEDATVNHNGTTQVNGNRFGVTDEVELRYHGGLNHLVAPTDAPTQVENLLPLRSGATENTYTDVPGVASMDDFFKKNPRRWLTCLSGECLEQKGVDGTGSGTIRFDVNATVSEQSVYDPYFYNLVGLPWLTGPNGLAGDGDDFPYSKGFQDRIQTASNRPGRKADLLAATLAVARGSMSPGDGPYKSNQTAKHGQSNALAPFPVLTEAYFQFWHATLNTDPTIANGDGTYQVPSYTWGTNTGYCLEFSNPFTTPVKLCNASGQGAQCCAWAPMITGVFLKNSCWLFTAAQATAWPDKDEDGDCVLLPGHKLLLYQDSGGIASTTTPAANLNAISAKVNAVVGSLPTAATITSGGANDLNGRPTLHAALSNGVINSDNFDAVNTQCTEVQSWVPARWSPMYGSVDYAPFYLTLPLSRKTVERSPVSATWLSPANQTPVGIVQVSARTWGLAAGLDLLQCRPARQNKVRADYYDTGYYDKLTTTANSKGLSLVPGLTPAAVPADLGDVKVAYNRAFNAFDATLLSTLGADDKGLSAKFPANTAGRASIQNDSLWFATNNWYWDAGSNRVRYRLPNRLASLGDMVRLAQIDFLNTLQGDATTRGSALGNKNQGNTYYTDSDIPHSVYQSLHDQSQETASGTFQAWPDVQALVTAGHSPLDILRFHPWSDTGTFAPYDAGVSSRNVPWNWTFEQVWSNGYPGLSNAVALDASSPQKAVAPIFVDGNANGVGLDTNAAGNLLKDWNGTEVDWAENMAYGRLNLNTAPVWLMEEALPIKDASIRKAVANLIGRLRANAGNNRSAFGLANTRANADRGVAYLSELLPAVVNAVKNNTLQSATGVTATWPTVPATDPVSGLPNAAKPASVTGSSYSYVGDKDLRINTLLDILGPLWQTASPRSDYFAAHILVQGYRANNFSLGVAEGTRVLILFRRTSSGVQEITRYTY